MKKFMKKGTWVLALMALMTLGIWGRGPKSRAASGSIALSSSQETVRKGDVFTVVCQLTSTEYFLDASFQLEYDTGKLQFISGGSKVTASGGILTVDSTGNETSTKKKTFSLQFAALKKGTTNIEVKGTPDVKDGDGTIFSISSNRLILEIKKKSAQAQETTPSGKPAEGPGGPGQPGEGAAVTPEPILSQDNDLKSLKTTALTMTPSFSPDVTEYEATVSNHTKVLYVSYKTKDGAASVILKGNEDLTEGTNDVEIVVRAENGQTKAYKIIVTKETAEETKVREEGQEDKENGTGIGFSVTKENDKIVISNDYEFQVLDPSDEDQAPSGYVLTNMEIDGVTIPTYTIKDDLDNNYLLLYLKGPSGETGFYQYDREEKTLQRYTGTLVAKVNSMGSGQEEGKTDGFVLFIIIIVLVIIILVLLIAMLKMMIRKKAEKSDQDYLDF